MPIEHTVQEKAAFIFVLTDEEILTENIRT